MSGDWIKQYAEKYTQRQQEKGNEQRRADLSRAAAPDMFQRIKDCVVRDLQSLHDAGAFPSVQFNDVSETSFAVNDLGSTASLLPTVAVGLEMILVKYYYAFPPRPGERDPHKSCGALRICCDLHGTTQVYKNNKPLAGEDEVSALLLKPLLDFVNT